MSTAADKLPTTCPLTTCERVERLAVTQAEHGRRLALLEQREEEWRIALDANTRALQQVTRLLDHGGERRSRTRRKGHQPG